MPAELVDTSIRFARTRHLMFFLSTPYQLLMILYFIRGSLGQKTENWVKSKFIKKWLQVTVFYLFFAMYSFLTMLPLRFLSYRIAVYYGTSFMTISHWFTNRGIDFIVDFIIYMVIIHVVLLLMNRFPRRWWLVAWIVFIPFAFFFMLMEPILIDPLYNDFHPIQNSALEGRILEMASDSGVSANRVFEVKMSDRTNTINGYVTGIGPTARIVLWDTALMQLDEDSILFLMAHEIAHYVYKDVYTAVGIAILFAFGGLFVVYICVEKINKNSLMRVPVAILTIYFLLFFISPATNAISRQIEKRADAFALEMTNDNEAGIRLFQTLATTSLNELNPPGLVRFFRSTHPSLFERIIVLMGE